MQCGLCAVVTGLFRRAMCIAGSRRGSGESYYQELASEIQKNRYSQSGTSSTGIEATTDYRKPEEVVTRIKEHSNLDTRERRSAEITVDSTEQNVFVRISEEATLGTSGTSAAMPGFPDATSGTEPIAITRRLSYMDQMLLQSLDVGRSIETRHTGRFLTMHKRRRKKLITRSLNKDQGILDDIFHGLVQCLLQRAGNWCFNAFTLETVTGGRSLPVLCVHLFHWYGLLQHFELDVVTVWKLFAFIEEGYHSTNPYHNSIHATDVTQAMHCFLQEGKIKTHLNNLEIMASLIAAVTHDLDHPGVNQPFLVATSNHLAALYQNTSVLENHHWRSAIGCLIESGVSDQLPAEIRPELQRHISSLILATDITRQQEFLTKFKDYLDNNTLNVKRAEDRHFILQIALKCADISNPCRPWEISRKWSYKVCEEFFRQGDYERQLNLPVTPLCDRRVTSIPKIQVGFFKFVVTPLYEEWHRFLGDGLSVSLMHYLRANHKKWETMILREASEETKTEISELEDEMDQNAISSAEEEDATNEDSGSIDLLIPTSGTPTQMESNTRRPSLPEKSVSVKRMGRRHSVPLSVTKSLGLFARSTERRESLPHEHSRMKNLLKFEEESILEPNSLLSSRTSFLESSTTTVDTERPVSAENLLPEPSIASITNSTEASRLSTVLQPDNQNKSIVQTKQLTRQQTFPPLQPYMRMRYMSTTAEMSQCYTQILMEGDSSSSSTPSPTKDESTCSGGHCGTPPDNEITNSLSSQRTKHHTVLKSPKESPNCQIGIEISGNKKVTRSGSSLLDSTTTKRNELNTSSEYSRRHSVQTCIPSSVHRNKRSASFQDSDSPPYSLRPDKCSNNSSLKTPNSSETIKSNVLKTNMENQRILLFSSSKKSDNIHHAAPSSFAKSNNKFNDCEVRRYSTPESKVTSDNDNVSGGRRFTTIPVSSELSVHKVFFIGSPPDSPPRQPSVSSLSDSGSGGENKRNINDSCNEDSVSSMSNKKDCDFVKEKGSKLAKLSFEIQMKENVDPLAPEDPNKSYNLNRRGSQGWARRRGSAPVGLLSKIDDLTTNVSSRGDHNCRRGSVPIDITRHQGSGVNRLALGPKGENLQLPRRASLPQEAALSNLLSNASPLTSDRDNCLVNNNINGGSNNNGIALVMDSSGVPNTGMPSPRRGSVPADISELRRDFFNRSSINNKTRNRKKVLRRRSSGGPEMFSGESIDGNDNSMWLTWKIELGKCDSIPEPVIKRRGSLPIEMVAVSHAGRYNFR